MRFEQLEQRALLAVTIDWVTVGDSGNAADTTGYGRVESDYRIAAYEVTNAQYAEFLNAVAKTDSHGLYMSNIGTDARGGITRDGTSGNFTYQVKANMGDKPVVFVSWFDAVRFANWMHNGQPIGPQGVATTEDGAYTLNGATGDALAPAKNAGARFFLPTENEWYKAAYYKGGGTDAGYWNYATQSDVPPTAVTAGLTGDGATGSTGNFANYDFSADWNGRDGNVTTRGTNGGPSFYGSFDQSGNVWEWNDLTDPAGSGRGLRGGSWGNASAFPLSSSSRLEFAPSSEVNYLGFRLARPVADPTNRTPTDINLSATAIAENAGASALIGTLSTTDPDVGNTFTYALVAGVGDTDNAAFSVVGDQLRATSSFDFEMRNSYSIRVRAFDQGGLFTEKAFTITVTDVNDRAPFFTSGPTGSVAENAPTATAIYTATTTDADGTPANGAVTYSIKPGVGDAGLVEIDTETGVVILRTWASLEYKQSYVFTVIATNTGTGATFMTEQTVTVTVTVADIDAWMQFVTVGNPRNAGQTQDYDIGGTLTFGAVNEAFRIMKFEFTNAQYAVFLNAIDPDGTNPNSVYNVNMGIDPRGGITNTGTTSGSRYATKFFMGDKPVNFVSWWDAARVANWLHNGAQAYRSSDSSATAPQNTGAYPVGTATSGDVVARNSGALFSIPTEDQWYKAAYYNPALVDGAGGYTMYGNGFSEPPGVVEAAGNGLGLMGITGNFANYKRGAQWNDQDGNVTRVGFNGGRSYYGVSDMSGNVFEWNDLDGAAGSTRGVRGGSWINDDDFGVSSANRVSPSPSGEFDYLGFRLASLPGPVVHATGSINSLSTTYRTASAAVGFSVSGIALAGDLTVTVPPGFELAKSESGPFAQTVSLTPTGGVMHQTLFVRLRSDLDVGSYSGNVTIAGGGAATETLAISASSVSRPLLRRATTLRLGSLTMGPSLIDVQYTDLAGEPTQPHEASRILLTAVAAGTAEKFDGSIWVDLLSPVNDDDPEETARQRAFRLISQQDLENEWVRWRPTPREGVSLNPFLVVGWNT